MFQNLDLYDAISLGIMNVLGDLSVDVVHQVISMYTLSRVLSLHCRYDSTHCLNMHLEVESRKVVLSFGHDEKLLSFCREDMFIS